MSPAEELRYLFLALQREGNRQLTEVLRPLELTPSQSEVLRVLQQFGALTLIQLGERLVCESGSPSRLVSGMVKSGYVQKNPNPNDRRAVVLSLTPQGWDKVAELDVVEAAYHSAIAEQIAVLPVAEFMPLIWQMVEGTEAGRALALRKAASQNSSND